MAQLSKIQLESKIAKQIAEQLVETLRLLSSSKEIISLLNELLTPTERLMIAKRLGIAVLLSKGYGYRDIRGILKVSFPTIRSVEFWLKHGDGYKKEVGRILLNEGMADFFQRVDRLLELMPIGVSRPV